MEHSSKQLCVKKYGVMPLLQITAHNLYTNSNKRQTHFLQLFQLRKLFMFYKHLNHQEQVDHVQ